MKAKEFRQQWSHKPTPIPQDATGLWYSEECVDQLMAEFAAQSEPEDVQLDVGAVGQKEIDISNLRFYSRMAAEHKWGTDVIHFGVIEQTLQEIADRLALLRRVSGKGEQKI